MGWGPDIADEKDIAESFGYSAKKREKDSL